MLASFHKFKYVDQKGWAAVKRLASVAPEVNLENHCMQVMKHARKGSTLALKPRLSITRSPNHKTGLISSKDFWRQLNCLSVNCKFALVEKMHTSKS